MKKILTIAIPCLVAACARVPSDPASKAQRQAELVGAPLIEKSQMCTDVLLKRFNTRPSTDVVRAGNAWVLFTYDLDGSGKATNISAVKSVFGGAFAKRALKDLQDSLFKEGVLRTGCKALTTVSIE
jgi:hypothetical protein